ncbi:DUF2478 domain-containing protein [Aquamicrobium lusatiense]|uniref:DUF2478 domain-containing protein n=1 Tax=Aquamicrobium lusatiense TaxID=89772 RepID=UPI00245513BD|nr:DUF2478 domain-containing protein [Aquamicrobium lusatiense]MDH4989350.1 DUF2478 domain-containing protein [Aquamicrobium lusatiense]
MRLGFVTLKGRGRIDLLLADVVQRLEARGCRLDAGALEQSVVWVDETLEKAELLVINKFGKREAEGKGLSGSIARAFERDIPVLVGVNGLNLPAFLEFSDELAQQLPPEAVQIVGPCLGVQIPGSGGSDRG